MLLMMALEAVQFSVGDKSFTRSHTYPKEIDDVPLLAPSPAYSRTDERRVWRSSPVLSVVHGCRGVCRGTNIFSQRGNISKLLHLNWLPVSVIFVYLLIAKL